MEGPALVGSNGKPAPLDELDAPRVSPAKSAAARRNGALSRGPVTAAGKARSSANRLTHGALSLAPVLPTESAEAWGTHLAATLEALAPENHMEALLAERVAGLAWRLGRVVRYETEAATTALEHVDKEATSDPRLTFAALDAPSFAELRERLAEFTGSSTALEAVRGLPDETALELDVAAAALEAVAQHFHRDTVDDVTAALGAAGLEGVNVDTWAGPAWTAGLVRRVVLKLATASGRKYEKGAVPLDVIAGELAYHATEARSALDKAKRRATELRRARTLPDEKTLERVTRYEAHLERSLCRTLHELERLRALRLGCAAAVPIALDVDVSTGAAVEAFASGADEHGA